VLLDEFDGGQLLAGAVSLLCQVKIKDRRASRSDVTLRQRVHHQQHVDRPFTLPVAGDRIEQVLGGVQRRSTAAAADSGRLHPRRQTLPDVVEVTSKSDEQRPREDIGERLAARQKLAGTECRQRGGVEQVELEVNGVSHLERALGVDRYVVPDARVRNVDRTEEVRRRRALSA